MSVAQPPDSHGFSDHQLGQRLAPLIARQAGSSLPFSAIIGQLQDLLGPDTGLLGPLRDLLGRPSFRQLVTLEQGSVRIGARDALLQELALTYNTAMVGRLAAVVDGCLDLPPAPLPPAAASSWGGAPYGSAPQPIPPPPAQLHQQPPPQQQPQPQPQPVASGSTSVSAALIALVSLLSGAVLVGVASLLVSSRQPLSNGSAPIAQAARPAAAERSPAAAPAAPEPAAPATAKSTASEAPAPSGAWGSASDYKFGQLPGGDYPNSCAFSRTDASGRITIDKDQLEFWACRDVGGDAENGYKVVWSDGKETTYTFQSGGDGLVVGTNGSTHPMRWRNDSHQGDPIIVISHQDGATSWIPGAID